MIRAKICGVTSEADAAQAARAGAEFVGINLWPPSKRYVALAEAGALARAAKEAAPTVQIVGVFVNPSRAELEAAIEEVPLDWVQLHGDEPPEACIGLGVPVIKAFRPREMPELAAIAAYDVAAILIDAPQAAYGGGGVAADWQLAAAATRLHPRVFVAGGLEPANLAAAIVATRPFAVDVASGVEADPRHKDPERVTRFIEIAHRDRVPRESMNEEQQVPGRFGDYGGRYIAETLMPAVEELTAAWAEAEQDPLFVAEFARLLRDYVGRPSRLTEAKRLSAEVGARVFLKREDLNHTGAHKINNCIGQALLARRMGKGRLIAETGAGQHGVATATVAALFGMPCDVYMGAEDVKRQALNVFRMKLLGTRVIPVESGTKTLKDAMNEALRDWVTNVRDTYYLIGSVAGPHPYPTIVREFQAVIGREVRLQLQDAVGRLPDALIACVGGGSNAAGLFAPFIDDAAVKMYGVEAAGEGIDTPRHAATLTRGRVGVLHGSKSYVLSTADGQIAEAHSISAGLDYPGVGPEHAHWKDLGRVRYLSRTDDEALAALERLAQTEGIICALETAHAVAALDEVAGELGPKGVVVINISGRGDKDMDTLMRHREAGQ